MTTPRYTPRDRRGDAIQSIVNIYIGQGGDEVGQLIAPVDFPGLYKAVGSLRSLGRTGHWFGGVRKWEECINYAHKTFCDNMGFSYVSHVIGDELRYATQARSELIRLFKWAVMQGAIYAGNGNY